MAFNKDRQGEEIQIMTPDVITNVTAGDLDVSKYSTVMFDADQTIDGTYLLPANLPLGLVTTRDTINIDTDSGMMAMWR